MAVTRKASRYGAAFDALADRWAALEREHDVIHPDRNECGGVGGCPMMRRAVEIMQDMEQLLDDWRLKP